jgi:hypothetical protein
MAGYDLETEGYSLGTEGVQFGDRRGTVWGLKGYGLGT